jgi:hypothetical protein
MLSVKEWRALALLVVAFLACYFLPVERLQEAVRLPGPALEALFLVRWYAREHVVLCLLPAFFIAGAIAVFVSKESVMKYLGARAHKALAYGVASVSGTILAVCSCTVLPLFAGIYRMGAGLGPASAFLYSGPAINVLAIVLTARVLGLELGIARAVGAIFFSVVVGLLMHLAFRKEELARAEAQMSLPAPEVKRPLRQTALYFGVMVGILVFANWGKPVESSGAWHAIYSAKWMVTGILSAVLAVILSSWYGVSRKRLLVTAIPVVLLSALFPTRPVLAFAAGVIGLSWVTATGKGEVGEWFETSWGFAKQVLPLLLAGVLVAGALLGRPGHEGLIPSRWVAGAVGGNSLFANFFASVAGAFMYFATLTEVPILQGLIGSGMGKGPALALLLAGPALSLPSMLVLRSLMGTKKTVVYTGLVVILSTVTGLIYGVLFRPVA